MAKTKKQEIAVKPEQPAGVGYSGQVTVTVKKGSRILSKNTYTNNGSTELFKFFTYCLQGDYTTAENYRPVRIKLFFNNAATPDDARKPENIISKADYKTAFIHTNTTATLLDTITETTATKANQNDSSSATLHFIVPAAYIQSTDNNSRKINQICLYREGIDDNKKYSAYYLCTKHDSTEETWNNITIDNDQISLIIDWKMTINNK